MRLRRTKQKQQQPQGEPYSLTKTLSKMVDEVVDPQPDPQWNVEELPPPTEESVRVLGLDTMPYNTLSCVAVENEETTNDDDDQSLIDKCRESISNFVDEAIDPKPEPERYQGGDGDDDSLIERVSLILDQTLFPDDDDDNRSFISQAAMVVDGIVEEIVDPKPDETYQQTNDYLCSCLG